MDRNKKNGTGRDSVFFKGGVALFLSLTAVIIAAGLLSRMSVILDSLNGIWKTMSPVVWGLGIAYLLCFPMRFFEKRLLKRFGLEDFDPTVVESRAEKKKRRRIRTVSVVLAFLILVVLIWGFCALLLPSLFDSIGTLISSMDDYTANAQDFIDRLLEKYPELTEYVSEALDRFESYLTGFVSTSLAPKLQSLLSLLTTSAIGFFSGLLHFVIGLIIAIYVLFAKDTFLLQAKKVLRAVCGDSASYWISDVVSHAHVYFGKFLTGKIIDSLIIGCICLIATSVLRIPYAVLVSVIVCITNIIPFFGPFLGAIPSAFLILMVQPMKCVTFLIMILVLQQLDGNVIGPKILGNQVNVSAFWIVVSILFFGKLMGVVGMIVGVPCFATLYYIVTILVERKLNKRGLSTAQVHRCEYPALSEEDRAPVVEEVEEIGDDSKEEDLQERLAVEVRRALEAAGKAISGRKHHGS